ncbi:MAG: hypothetical protein IJ594_00350, partial [Oscillospiraceae bacterium]|nr:hypothetical protein [Oscillospiraceae bacterium]
GSGVRVPEDHVVNVFFHRIPSFVCGAYRHPMRRARILCPSAPGGAEKRRRVCEHFSNKRPQTKNFA